MEQGDLKISNDKPRTQCPQDKEHVRVADAILFK